MVFPLIAFMLPLAKRILRDTLILTRYLFQLKMVIGQS